MSQSTSINLGGSGALLLTLTLLILKVSGAINIGWLWVFFPLWVGPALVLGFVGILIGIVTLCLLIAFIAAIFGAAYGK